MHLNRFNPIANIQKWLLICTIVYEYCTVGSTEIWFAQTSKSQMHKTISETSMGILSFQNNSHIPFLSRRIPQLNGDILLIDMQSFYMKIDTYQHAIILHMFAYQTNIPRVLGRFPVNVPFTRRIISDDLPTDASPASTTRNVRSGGPVGSYGFYSIMYQLMNDYYLWSSANSSRCSWSLMLQFRSRIIGTRITMSCSIAEWQSAISNISWCCLEMMID